MNKFNVILLPQFIFTYFLALNSFAMNAEAATKIDALFVLGYRDAWEDDFVSQEKICLEQAVRTKLTGDKTKAGAQFLLCAAHGSTIAMHHLGMLAKDVDHSAAADWFSLAAILHYHKSGLCLSVAHNALQSLGIKLQFPQEVPTTKGQSSQRTNKQKQSLQTAKSDLKIADTRWRNVSSKLAMLLASIKAPREKLLANAFITLASPFHSGTMQFAPILQLSISSLNSVEYSFLGERLFAKVIKAVTPTGADLTVLNVQHQNMENALLDSLLREHSTGIFGIDDNLVEFERRIRFAHSDEQRYHVANILYRADATPHAIKKTERVSRALEFLAGIDTPPAHEILHDMYRDRVLGDELPEDERKALMQKHLDKTENGQRKEYREALMHFVFRDFDKVLEIAKRLLEQNFDKPGTLYQLIAWTIHGQLANGTRVMDRHAFLEMYAYTKIAAAAGQESVLPLLLMLDTNIDLIWELTEDYVDDNSHSEEEIAQHDDVASEEESVEMSNNETTKSSLTIHADVVDASNASMTSVKKRPRRTDTKKEKQKRKLIRVLAEIKSDVKTLADNSKAPKTHPVRFANDTVEKQFNKLANKAKKKIDELFVDIMNKPWGTEGSGKPEILKNHGKFGRMISRRIDDENRLVYDFIDNAIVIHSCVGHY